MDCPHADKLPLPKLLADAMLGELARWLRIVGFDTRYMQGSDAAIAHCARAEGRILLTRDRALARRKGLRTLLLRSETLEAQLAEVVAILGMPPSEAPTRCMACNAPLVSVAKTAVRDLVPAYVLKTHEAFQQCPECGRIYWKGTHWQTIAARLDDIAT